MIDLKAIRALADKATPGPWLIDEDSLDVRICDGQCGVPDPGGSHHYCSSVIHSEGYVSSRDAVFIAAARTAVPELIGEIERLRVLVTRWEALGARHDLALREPGCVCTHEQGDSACPVHPTCVDCGVALVLNICSECDVP